MLYVLRATCEAYTTSANITVIRPSTVELSTTNYLVLQSTTCFCGATESVWAAYPHSNKFRLVAICEGMLIG